MGFSLLNHPAMGVPPFMDTPNWEIPSSGWVYTPYLWCSSDKLIFPNGSNRIQMVLCSKTFHSWQSLLIHSHSLSLNVCAKEMFSNSWIPTFLDISHWRSSPSPSQGPGTIGGRFENVGVENTEEHRSGGYGWLQIGHGMGFKMVKACNYPPSILFCGATVCLFFLDMFRIQTRNPSFTVGGSIVATMCSPNTYHWLKSLIPLLLTATSTEEHGRSWKNHEESLPGIQAKIVFTFLGPRWGNWLPTNQI